MPKVLIEMLKDHQSAKSQRVMEALLQMKKLDMEKLDMEKLQRAYAG